jgi:hypothetical protein
VSWVVLNGSEDTAVAPEKVSLLGDAAEALPTDTTADPAQVSAATTSKRLPLFIVTSKLGIAGKRLRVSAGPVTNQ